MKKKIVSCVMVVICGGVFLTLCGQSIRHTINQASPDYYLQPVHALPEKDSTSAYGEFKEQALFDIRYNELMLIRLHTEIDDGNKQIKAKYFSLIIELRQRNNGLRNRMLEYREGNQHNWTAFEYDFATDMDQLERTIRSLQISKGMLI